MDLIDYQGLEQQFDEAQAVWKKADPFPYCQLDNFLEPSAAQTIADDFPETLRRANKDPYAPKKHLDVKRKIGTSSPKFMSPLQQAFFEQVNDEKFIKYLERLTGISPLYADENLSGSGLHEIYPGGYLNLHADFNYHPKNFRLRCLNLIVYLNADWQEDWNGHLELWPEKLDGEPVMIAPLMNKAALFRTSETSWHGHTRPLNVPEGKTRRSLAVYYYTDWPEGLEQREQTLYVQTPAQRAELRAILEQSFHTFRHEKHAIKAAPMFQPIHVRKMYNEMLAERATQSPDALNKAQAGEDATNG